MHAGKCSKVIWLLWNKSWLPLECMTLMCLREFPSHSGRFLISWDSGHRQFHTGPHVVMHTPSCDALGSPVSSPACTSQPQTRPRIRLKIHQSLNNSIQFPVPGNTHIWIFPIQAYSQYIWVWRAERLIQSELVWSAFSVRQTVLR